jgi:hypothetical protein
MKYEHQKTSLVKKHSLYYKFSTLLCKKKIQLRSYTYYEKKRDRVGGVGGGVWEQGAEDIT